MSQYEVMTYIREEEDWVTAKQVIERFCHITEGSVRRKLRILSRDGYLSCRYNREFRRTEYRIRLDTYR